jgi:mono/diheme cytochrome c family protein
VEKCRLCCWSVALSLALGFGSPLQAATETLSPVAAKIDYATQIQPIFQRHCLKCHGPDKSDGDLRLDQRTFLVRGGDSRTNLLHLPIDQNELVRRLKSDEPGDRMPLGMPALDADSVQRIVEWIEQGGAWPMPPAPPSRLPPQLSVWERLVMVAVDRYDAWQLATLSPAGYRLLGVLVAVLVLARARETRDKQRAQGRPVGRWVEILAQVSWGYPLSGVLAAALYGGFLYTADLRAAPAKSQSQIVDLQVRLNPSVNATRRIRPKHPPRMGGEYYRGNDERNAALFNGGFYRTCTFRVLLVGADGAVVGWGEPLPQEAALHLAIEQSPFATSKLFSKEIMGLVGLLALEPAKMPADPAPRYALVKPGAGERSWSANFPLDLPVSDSPNPKYEGTIYLYRDLRTVAGKLTGDCQYAIGYKLVIADGKLTPESEIWMESINNGLAIGWLADGQISAD